MKTVDSPQNNLAYQKELFNVIDKLISLRTDLIKSTVLLLNEGKDKEWPSLLSQVKLVRKHIDKTEDQNFKTISEILKGLDTPIRSLEQNLDLKNNFIQVISEQTLEVPIESEQ